MGFEQIAPNISYNLGPNQIPIAAPMAIPEKRDGISSPPNAMNTCQIRTPIINPNAAPNPRSKMLIVEPTTSVLDGSSSTSAWISQEPPSGPRMTAAQPSTTPAPPP